MKLIILGFQLIILKIKELEFTPKGIYSVKSVNWANNTTINPQPKQNS